MLALRREPMVECGCEEVKTSLALWIALRSAGFVTVVALHVSGAVSCPSCSFCFSERIGQVSFCLTAERRSSGLVVASCVGVAALVCRLVRFNWTLLCGGLQYSWWRRWVYVAPSFTSSTRDAVDIVLNVKWGQIRATGINIHKVL